MKVNIPTIPFLWDNGQVQGSILSFFHLYKQPVLANAMGEVLPNMKLLLFALAFVALLTMIFFFLHFIIVLLFIFK